MPIDRILTGYRQFRKRYTTQKSLFDRLAREGQHPEVLWIGCSDSRVVPEQISGADPGDLFVMRNVANVVPPCEASDDGSGSVVEFAVLHVRVKHIIVCGHTECVGVKTVSEGVDREHESHLSSWLEWIRPAWDQIDQSSVAESQRFLAAVKTNVMIQRDNLKTYPCVRKAVANQTLTLHGWLYDLHSADLWAFNDASKEWRKLIDPPAEDS